MPPVTTQPVPGEFDKHSTPSLLLLLLLLLSTLILGFVATKGRAFLFVYNSIKSLAFCYPYQIDLYNL